MDKILSHLGLTKMMKRVKFGGVVGKLTLLGVAVVVSLAVISFRVSPAGALAVAIGVFVFALFLVAAIFIYADRHPLEATLEGTEIIALEEHRGMAMKSGEVPENTKVVPDSQPAIESADDVPEE